MVDTARRITRTWTAVQQTRLVCPTAPMAECGQHFAIEVKTTGQLIAESQRLYLGAPSNQASERYMHYQLAVAGRVINMPNPGASAQPSITLMECQRYAQHLIEKGRRAGLDAEEARDLIALLDQAQCLIEQIDGAFQEAT